MKPLHPLLVHFPIALLLLSVAADVIGFFTGIASLLHAGWWALLGAAAGSIATVAAGLFDMRRAELTEEVHQRVHRHMKVGFVLLAAILGLAFWRWRIFIDAPSHIPVYYLDLAVLTAALAAFQGWLGGELVYGDGVFVQQGKPQADTDAPSATKPQSPPGAKAAAKPHRH